MAAVSQYLLWVKEEILATSLIGLSFNSSFVFAYFAAPFYGGVLADESSQIFSMTNIPPNLAENCALGLIFLGIAIYQHVNKLS